MKQVLFKIIYHTIALALCCIILLQSFQLTARFKKSVLKNNLKIEETTAILSFLSNESNSNTSVFYWLKNNIKICHSSSTNSENEEEETKEVEKDELCYSQCQLPIVLSHLDLAMNDVLLQKLPNPFLLSSSPPPEAN
jgi:hypothetical protein